MPKVKHKVKVAAIVTIRNAGRMTPAGRKRVATWLRAHALLLQQEGKNYSSRFTGRYYYR